MFKITVFNTPNSNPSTNPTIEPIVHPTNGKVAFCLHNFNTAEAIDAYTPNELLEIRNAIDQAINTNCNISDIKGQTFMWDFDLICLTSPNNEV